MSDEGTLPEYGARRRPAAQSAQHVELVRDAQGRLYDAETGAFRDASDVLAALANQLTLHVRNEDGDDVTQETVAAARDEPSEPVNALAGLLDAAGGLLGEARARAERPPDLGIDVENTDEARPSRSARARPRGPVTVSSGTRKGQPVYRCECLVHSASTLLWDQVSDLRTILETSPGLRSYQLEGDPPRSATGLVRFAWGPVERVRPIRYDLTVVTELERLQVEVSAGKDVVRLHGAFELERLSRTTSHLSYEVRVEVAASSGLTAALMKRSATDIAEQHANRVIDRVVTLAEAAQFAQEVLGGVQ